MWAHSNTRENILMKIWGTVEMTKQKTLNWYAVQSDAENEWTKYEIQAKVPELGPVRSFNAMMQRLVKNLNELGSGIGALDATQENDITFPD